MVDRVDKCALARRLLGSGLLAAALLVLRGRSVGVRLSGRARVRLGSRRVRLVAGRELERALLERAGGLGAGGVVLGGRLRVVVVVVVVGGGRGGKG